MNLRFLPARGKQQGLSLIELMIALVLGLVVIGGVAGVFLANRESYRTSEALGRMQENARYAFEVLGRSVRAAGGNPCGVDKVANVLNNQSSTWWANWGNALRGFEGGNATDDTAFPKAIGTTVASRVGGTDALIVITGSDDTGVVVVDHNPNSAQFKVNTQQHGLNDGDVVMACDTDHAAIFQVTNANSSNVTIVHNTGTGNPGNCSKGLGYPTVCTTNGTSYQFNAGGFLVKLKAEAWYVGINPRGGRSLYRMLLNGTPQEFVPDVSNVQMQYLLQDATDYVPANSVTDWLKVRAVRVELTTTDPTVRVNGGNLSRTWAVVFTPRNVFQ